MPMPQMASFAPNQQLQSAQQADNTDRARAYKSRNKRPCDFWYAQNSPRLTMPTDALLTADTRKRLAI
jgi:hypothetical protein